MFLLLQLFVERQQLRFPSQAVAEQRLRHHPLNTETLLFYFLQVRDGPWQSSLYNGKVMLYRRETQQSAWGLMAISTGSFVVIPSESTTIIVRCSFAVLDELPIEAAAAAAAATTTTTTNYGKWCISQSNPTFRVQGVEFTQYILPRHAGCRCPLAALCGHHLSQKSRLACGF